MAYILIERETDDPKYEYKEECDTLEEAQARMKYAYESIVYHTDSNVIDKSDFSSRSAYVCIGDNKIFWDIEEKSDMKRYVVITWPESQDLMDRDGFEENCHLINDDKGLDEYGSSAYFVDENWLNNLSD